MVSSASRFTICLMLLGLGGCYVPAPVAPVAPYPAPVAYPYQPNYGAYYPTYPAYYPGYYAPPAAYYGPNVSIGLGFGGGGYWRHR